MRIGIDIGGTHTDGALIGESRLIAAAKTPTDHDNLLLSINRVLQALLVGQDARRVATLNLSTTLTTNAIINQTIDPVGMLVSAGPGIAPETYRIGDHYHLIYGSLDHVGTETAELNEQDIEEALSACREQGVVCYGIVSKFSPRNPIHEHQLAKALGDQAEVVTQGHLVSGRLNFGRRIHTAYYNSAVWRLFRRFAASLTLSLQGLGLEHVEVNILKADGGTMPLDRAMEAPVQSILSGPAASVMGILAVAPAEEDLIMLDIGGTTADIALFAGGAPLLEREGIAIDNRPTLVRAIRVESIGVGGDSQITVEEGTVRTGPRRVGPCMATGGTTPALMDACNLLGLAEFGDIDQSRAGITGLASTCGRSPEELAANAVTAAIETLADKIEAMIREVNTKPVYTIHEILEDRRITPKRLVVIGGPAPVLRARLAERLGIEVVVPPLHEVVNAVGAALTRTTSHLALTVNTARGMFSAPRLGVFRTVARSYSLDKAVADAKDLLQQDLLRAGVQLGDEDIQITQADAFNMVEGSYTAGKNIRVMVQVRPAVLARLEPTQVAVIPA
ncbi:MAG: hydantoinase/oxoprolinase family protein [Desulfobulbus sp.]|jgi:N-methylhydantoinase A/oxoprolinase/acetone carboxylase beta subunit